MSFGENSLKIELGKPICKRSFLMWGPKILPKNEKENVFYNTLGFDCGPTFCDSNSGGKYMNIE